jgi:Na+:H+ antiporter, NhaA family
MSIPARSRGIGKTRAEHSYATRQFLLPTQSYIHTESISGFILLFAGLAALVWANSPWKEVYHSLLHVTLGADLKFFSIHKTLLHWINEGFMTIFFFVVGLEIKRELVRGSLSSVKKATLPIVAALGGMVVPAALYLFFNLGGPGERGWGVPMATDIAFSLAVLSLLGKRMPLELRIFLLALAVADDVGAILVIAFFYADHVSFAAMGWAAFILGIIHLMKRLEISTFGPYRMMGFLFWLAVMQSGVHATIAGVILGLMTPAKPYLNAQEFKDKAQALFKQFEGTLEKKQTVQGEVLIGQMEELTLKTEAPLDHLVRVVHPWSNFLILPLFALANSGVTFSGGFLHQAFSSPVTLGIVLGLVLGKVAGIFSLSWLAVQLKFASLPAHVSWRHVAGLGLLAGIGFTVSLFIADLAFINPIVQAQAKIGILIASLLAGTMGFIYLRFCSK